MSTQSDSLCLHLRSSLLSLFSSQAFTIKSKLFGFLAFTVRWFHYANAKLVAASVFSFTFLDGIEDAHLLSLRLPHIRNWFFRNVINQRRTGQHAHVTENQRDGQFVLRAGKNTLLSFSHKPINMSKLTSDDKCLDECRFQTLKWHDQQSLKNNKSSPECHI